MKNNDIKYFIYARKSTEGDGRQILSIPAQIDDALRLQAREGLTVTNRFTDSRSAKIPLNRPEYSDMIKRLKKGEASGIIVWKIDRLARNHLEGGELIHLLQTGVIKSIYTPNREYQSKDSALLISLEASMASQYSVDLAENVKRGLSKKVSLGQPPYIAPIGYLNTKRVEHGSNSIVPDPKRWHLMRKAFDLMLSRQYTIDQVASILNNEHNFRTRSTAKRTSKPVSKSVLHHSFTDPFYTGHFNYMGELHEGKFKPMISLEEFDLMQQILGRKEKAKPHKHSFAFTGLITCGNCGCAITASKKLKQLKSTGEYKTYTFYHCTKRKGFDICPKTKFITEKEMELMIESELEKLSLMPLWKDFAIETIKEDYADVLQKHEELLKNTRDYEQKLLLELDTLLDLRISNELTEEKYKQKKAEKQSLLFRVQEKYKRTEKNINDWMYKIENKLNFAESAVKSFKTADPKLRKSICSYIGWNWVLQGKNLTFSKHEWFSDIEEMNNHLQSKKEQLELIKTYEEFKQTPLFNVVRSVMRGLRDHIVTDMCNKREKSQNDITNPKLIDIEI